MDTDAPKPGPPLPRPVPEPSWRDFVEQLRSRFAGSHSANEADEPGIDRPGRTTAPTRRSPTSWLVVMLLAAAIAIWAVSRSQPGDSPALETLLPAITSADLPEGPVGDLAPEAEQAGLVVVHVAGAVSAPGLVTVSSDSRVADAIVAAGGALPSADTDRINLAAVVSDSQRIYVPTEGEAVTVAEPLPGAGEPSAAALVDINTADVGELDALPGIGPATATAIVAHRDKHGPFLTVGALESVPGIGPAKLEQLRPLVVATS